MARVTYPIEPAFSVASIGTRRVSLAESLTPLAGMQYPVCPYMVARVPLESSET